MFENESCGRTGRWFMPEKIVSGGQTGADRAALDVALELGLKVGGWIARGRRTEDGQLPDRYPNFLETDSQEPQLRTELNVRDSDATLILSHGELSGGSLLTLKLTRRLGRPVLHLDLAALGEHEATRQLRQWLAVVRPHALNVAGPRNSEDPMIFEATKRVLRAALSVPPGCGRRESGPMQP